MVGMIVIPMDFGDDDWMSLADLSIYFSLEQLKNICEG
jgi:hypothetical protein